MKKLFVMALLLATLHAVGQPTEKTCPSFEPSKDPAKWKWMDRDCKIRTRAELDKKLANHILWLKNYENELNRPPEEVPQRVWGDRLRADLTDANLRNANLTGASLDDANLTGAHLGNADLTGAHMFGADLRGAHLSPASLIDAHLGEVNLTGADLTDADLRDANLNGAYLTGAHLFGADLTRSDLANAHLTGVQLAGAHLTGADLTDADLRDANLDGAYLTDANLTESDLSGSNLTETDLRGAHLARAMLWNADFEPKVVPSAGDIARAEGLSTLRLDTISENAPKEPVWAKVRGWFKGHFHWSKSGNEKRPDDFIENRGNPIPMQDLRKELRDAGYLDAEREVNLAYHRMNQSWWQEALFDWTCEWGANWRRPLWILAGLAWVCSVVYWVMLRFRGLRRWNRLYVVGNKGKREQRLLVGQRAPAQGWFHGPQWKWWHPRRMIGSPWRRARWEMRLYATALLFSLMSVVNLGVQGLDPGRWVRLLHRREFDLRARGMIRAVAGVQSLLSLGLLTLFVLTVLGHPIE